MNIDSFVFIRACTDVLLHQVTVRLRLEVFQHFEKIRFRQISARQILELHHERSASN